MLSELGIDVSTWQGKMDFAKAAAAGARYAIIRAGSCNRDTGALYTDFQFKRNRDAVKDSPLRYGFYWYFRPNHSPVAQARYFADLIAQEPYTEAYVADCETAGGIQDAGLVADRTFQFLDFLELSGIALHPGDIYTRASYWNIMVARNQAWKRYGLHVARYVSRLDASDRPIGLTGPWSDGRFVIRDWTEPKRWQYAADGDFLGQKYGAESRHIDMNLQWSNTAPPLPPPPPLPEKALWHGRVTAWLGLNIRKEPRVSGARLGALRYGTVVDVLEVQSGWARIKPGWVSVQYLSRVEV